MSNFFSNRQSASATSRDLGAIYEQTHHGSYFPPGTLSYTVQCQTSKRNNTQRGYTRLVFPSTAQADVTERYRAAIAGLPNAKDVDVDTLRRFLMRGRLNVVCYVTCDTYFMLISDLSSVTHTRPSSRPMGYLFKLYPSDAGFSVDPTCANMIWMPPLNLCITENFNLI